MQIDRTASAIDAVAPDAGEVVTPQVSTTGSMAIMGDSTVQIPSNADGDVVITSTTVDARPIASVSVSLPEEIVSKPARVARDGTVVYQSSQKRGTHGAVQVLSDNLVRLQTVIESAQGSHRFTYRFDDTVPVLNRDGSVDLVKKIQSEGVLIEGTVGHIQPAWAVDAKGKPVPTHYEVNGRGKIVQVVDVNKRTAYPVVADPTIGFTWQGINVWFNRAETKTIGNAPAAGVIMLGTLVSANGIAIALGWSTGAVMGYASIVYSRGECLKFTWPISWVSFGSYRGGNCR